MTIFHDQYEFLKAADAEVGTLDAEILAQRLILEEFNEFMIEKPETVNKIKECLDLIYVCSQYLNSTIGPDLALECWNALHANNMSKCIDGKLVKREDGKVLKPNDYKPLDLREVLNAD